MDELFKLIANLGFPIVVSMYLLARIERKLDNLIQLVLDLINVVETDEYLDHMEAAMRQKESEVKIT